MNDPNGNGHTYTEFCCNFLTEVWFRNIPNFFSVFVSILCLWFTFRNMIQLMDWCYRSTFIKFFKSAAATGWPAQWAWIALMEVKWHLFLCCGKFLPFIQLLIEFLLYCKPRHMLQSKQDKSLLCKFQKESSVPIFSALLQAIKMQKCELLTYRYTIPKIVTTLCFSRRNYVHLNY